MWFGMARMYSVMPGKNICRGSAFSFSNFSAIRVLAASALSRIPSSSSALVLLCFLSAIYHAPLFKATLVVIWLGAGSGSKHCQRRYIL